MEIDLFCCLCSGLCDELVTRSEESYPVCLCLTMCDLGTSTNSHRSPQFGCSHTEGINIKFTYRHCKCSWRLLAALRFCGSICLWAFNRTNFGIRCMCRNFKGTPDRCVRTFFLRNYNIVVTLKTNTFFMFLPPNVEQVRCEYTNCNIFERIISV